MSSPDSNPSEPVGRDDAERLEGIKRWVEYIREQPPEVWGPQQNRLVDAQLQSAREANLSPSRERRVRAFAEAMSVDDSDDE